MSAYQTRKRPGRTGRDFAKQNELMRQLYGSERTAQARRRLPPYGREVAEALLAGQHPNVRLYACRDAWRLAGEHRYTFGPASTLVLPPDADPAGLRWLPVDLVGNVTGLSGDDLQALARALVRDGVKLAYLLDAEQPERGLCVVAKEVRHE